MPCIVVSLLVSSCVVALCYHVVLCCVVLCCVVLCCVVLCCCCAVLSYLVLSYLVLCCACVCVLFLVLLSSLLSTLVVLRPCLVLSCLIFTLFWVASLSSSRLIYSLVLAWLSSSIVNSRLRNGLSWVDLLNVGPMPMRSLCYWCKRTLAEHPPTNQEITNDQTQKHGATRPVTSRHDTTRQWQ